MLFSSTIERDVPAFHRSKPLPRGSGIPLGLLGLMTCVLGCGESGPRLATVTGQVLFDGKPVADAGVLFVPTTPGPAASASTDSEGKFRLMTGSREGALVAGHRVVISKTETRGVSTDSEGLSGAVVDGGWLFVEHLPPRYNDPKTSGLTADVVADSENSFTFELTASEDEQP